MASTASDLLKFEKQATGENASDWGTRANRAMSRLEEAIADITNIVVTTTNYTLEDTQYTEHVDGSNTSESHCAAVKVTGALTGNRQVIVPLRNKIYWIWNATSGAYTLTVIGASGNGIEVPQGFQMAVICDGTNVEALSIATTEAGALGPLAADLDMNGKNIDDTSGNELIKFTETASAVNEYTIANQAAGTSPTISATGGDTNIDVNLVPKGTGVLKENNVAVGLTGKHALPVPAAGMYTASTNGASSGSVETSSNAVMLRTFDFDKDTDEYVQFALPMPKSWDEGTVTVIFHWSHPTTTTNFGVSWAIQAVAFGNSDALDAAFGTAVVVDDTGGTTDDLFITAATAAVTVSGTPAAEDFVIFRVFRDVSDSNDNMAVDARLHSCTIFITTNAGNDT